MGIGNTYPNPSVGCCIVIDDKIIGEGYHKQYGVKHAEVNAIESVKNQSLLKKSVLYVNLEPCSHHGVTAPCTSSIIRSKLKEVIYSVIDIDKLFQEILRKLSTCSDL